MILAAERAERPELDALDELVERMATPADFESYRRADIRFHIGVAEAARSPHLVTEMTEVQGQMSDLIALHRPPRGGADPSNAQHRKLVALLRARRRRPCRGPDAPAHPRHRAHPRRLRRPPLGRIGLGPLAIAGAAQARIRSPLGSSSGSFATSPSIHSPKISTSTSVPGLGVLGRQVGVGDRAPDGVAVAAGGHAARDLAADPHRLVAERDRARVGEQRGSRASSAGRAPSPRPAPRGR